jgi:putative ABC transport system permease protein
MWSNLPYSLTTLWHERQRFLPGILAVAFSALLIALQCGLLLGLFSITSLPIDHTDADIWVGAPQVLSVDLGRPIPESFLSRVADQPEVQNCELYVQGFAYWIKPRGGSELCMVIGGRLGLDDPEKRPMGAIKELTPELRCLIQEPGAIICDESEKSRLGITGVGDTAEVSGTRVRVVGIVHGMKSIAGPFVFCNVETARKLLYRQGSNQTYYIIARLKPEHKQNAQAVVDRINHDDMNKDKLLAFTSGEFSRRTQLHWLTTTRAGIALGYAAALGLLVGGVVTSQTLYAATAASMREYAVLRALGIPRWRMALSVIAQSLWVGIIGVGLVAWPAVEILARIADWLGAKVLLPWWLLILSAAVTLVVALLSGLFALRSLRSVEPAVLLR